MCYSRAKSKRFKSDLRILHVQDLNFVLRLEIFVHEDRQLLAFLLILGVDPIYSTWQAFSQALLVDSPLFSYIDVWHANFLPPRLTIGEARDLGPRYTCSEELAPIQDESIELVSQNRRVHVPVEPETPVEPEAPIEPEALTQVAEEAAAKSTSSLGTKSDQGHDMVTRRTMKINHFVPGA